MVQSPAMKLPFFSLARRASLDRKNLIGRSGLSGRARGEGGLGGCADDLLCSGCLAPLISPMVLSLTAESVCWSTSHGNWLPSWPSNPPATEPLRRGTPEPTCQDRAASRPSVYLL